MRELDRASCDSPNALINGVPEVPKGCSEGFCHFCHCLI